MEWSIEFVLFTVSRLLLGGMFFVFGLNAYFQWWPLPPATEKMNEFSEHLIKTGIILPVVKVFEVLFGFLLIINQFSFLASLALAPICFFIVLSHLVFNKRLGWGMAAFVAVNMSLLLLTQREMIKILFQN